MKKASDNAPETTADEMRPEYDFSGGVRGKYASEYLRGHTVTIHRKDGSTVVERYGPPEDAIVLAPDVKAYFPDSEAVNEALRGLIRLAPAGPRDR